MCLALCACQDTVYKMADSLDEFLSGTEVDIKQTPNAIKEPEVSTYNGRKGDVVDIKVEEIPLDEMPSDKISQGNGERDTSPVEYENRKVGTFHAEELDNIKSLSEDEIRNAQRKAKGRYYYEIMDASDKQIYCEILYILMEMGEETKLSTLSETQVERVFNLLLDDVPDLFYVSGYACTRYTLGDELKTITFSGTYTMEKDKKADYEKKIDEAYGRFLASFREAYPNGADDYHTIKYIYEYIIINTAYDLNAPDNQNIISSMINHQSVCAGYAREFQYLTEKLGFEGALVEGFVKENSGHAWNLIKADGDYYYVDATFGDPNYSTFDDRLPPINYEFLLANEENLSKTHKFTNKELMPSCVSMADNYYIREGRYFVSVDKDLLKTAFENAYNNGEDILMLKMSDIDVYNGIWKYLIEEQNIFKLMKRKKESVAYVESPDMCNMVFWL